MKEVGIEFCDNKEIFYIWDDGEYYMINGSTGYPTMRRRASFNVCLHGFSISFQSICSQIRVYLLCNAISSSDAGVLCRPDMPEGCQRVKSFHNIRLHS